MSRRIADNDWDDDEFGESSEDDDSTVPCPYCKRPIPEDTPRCPYCEQYISEEDAPPSSKPTWIIVGVLLCLVIVFLWIVG